MLSYFCELKNKPCYEVKIPKANRDFASFDGVQGMVVVTASRFLGLFVK